VIHYFPGIASAAIDEVVHQTWQDNILASIVPPKLVEMIKAGDIEWMQGVRIMADDPTTRSKKGRHQEEMMSILDLKLLKPKNLKKYKYIELFAGMGGFRAGIDQLDAECVLVSEFDKQARVTYDSNYGNGGHLVSDLNWLPAQLIPEHDLLTGGFPC
jgi:hypothetical protein